MRTEKELWARIQVLGKLLLTDKQSVEMKMLWVELNERFPLKREEVFKFFNQQRSSMTKIEIRQKYAKLWDKHGIDENELR